MTKPRIALLVNQVAPSRVGLYEHLAKTLDLTILHGGLEWNRGSWKKVSVKGACDRRMAGWQWSVPRRERGEIFDHWFLHLEPGYITELIRERPDGVVTFEMGFRTLVALAYGTCFRKPVWVWWGGTPHTERRVGQFRKFLRGFIALWAKRWISYGQTSTEYLLTLGIPRERILQVQNCVDEAWYNAPAEPGLDVHPKPVLLHVGQMIARKGVREFLSAVARLQQEGLSFSTVLVGSGSDSAKLQRLASNLGLANIHFRPAQPPEAMPAFYRSADVLVFPTMEDVWGLVANEAILSGLRVLCSRYAGCAPELFDSESIFDPADEKEFVAALRRAVTGQLPRADRSRLWSSAKVGDTIADAVLDTCGGKDPSTPRISASEISRSLHESRRVRSRG